MVIRIILLAVFGVAAAGAAAVRILPMEASVWHIDPDEAVRTGKPNDYLVAEGGDREPVVRPEAPMDLASRLDSVALSEDGVEVLEGSLSDGFITYIQRSKLMGYPDAISVKITPEETGSRLVMWSRSRYGQSDMGVNRARVERWLTGLEAG